MNPGTYPAARLYLFLSYHVFRIRGDESREFGGQDGVWKAGTFSSGSGYFRVKFGIEI